MFDQVLADIGDEQSIAMSLSTFSGHVRNLVAILDAATDRSLVLLDEVAGGTDPVEGAALARALLARLTSQARLTVATSHYPELKEWASATEGVDERRHGVRPGDGEAPVPHHARATRHVARAPHRRAPRPRRLTSWPKPARSIAPERLRVAELLAEAEAAEERAAEDRESAASARAAAESSRDAAEDRVAELEQEIERVRASARAERERALAEAEQELAGTRAELDALRAEIRAARRLERERRRATTPTALAKERERDRRLGAASDRAAQRRSSAARRPTSRCRSPSPLAPGDPVVAPELGVRGTIAEIARDDAVVVGRGGLRVRVPVARLRPDRDAAADAPEDQAVTIRTPTPTDAPSELDLRGRTAQEAREALRSLRRHGRPRGTRRGPRHPRPRHRRDPKGRPGRALPPSARLLARAGLGGRRDRRPARSLTVASAAVCVAFDGG